MMCIQQYTYNVNVCTLLGVKRAEKTTDESLKSPIIPLFSNCKRLIEYKIQIKMYEKSAEMSILLDPFRLKFHVHEKRQQGR